MICLLSKEHRSLFQCHSSKASVLQHSAFFMVQLSHMYMTPGKTITLTRWNFVGKVKSLFFNMLSRFVIGFLPRSRHLLISCLQFLGGSDSKASACNSRDLGLIPGSGRSPGEGNGNPLQYSCLENSMNGGTWWAAVHGVAKSRTRLSDFIFTFHFHTLEKEMATHSSILAWRIPGTGEPGGLPSMGSHRVRHD